MDVVNLEDKFGSSAITGRPRSWPSSTTIMSRRSSCWASSSGTSTTRPTSCSWSPKVRLLIRFRDRDVTLGPGDLLVVPRGVEHLPIAEEECEALLIEPAGTLNTGDAGGARTVLPEWI